MIAGSQCRRCYRTAFESGYPPYLCVQCIGRGETTTADADRVGCLACVGGFVLVVSSLILAAFTPPILF